MAIKKPATQEELDLQKAEEEGMTLTQKRAANLKKSGGKKEKKGLFKRKEKKEPEPEKETDKEEKEEKKVKAKRVTEEARDKKEKKGKNPYKHLRVGTREKIMFSKHLAVMLDAGIPLREALQVMTEQVTSKGLKKMLAVMIDDLSDGFTMSSSLEKFPKVFKPFSVNIVRVGESSGTLPNALHYQAVQLEKARELKGKIRGAMLYPIIIFFGAIGIAAYLSFYILPRLMPLFKSLDVKLPTMTRMLLASSAFVSDYWYILIAVFIGIMVLWSLLYRIQGFKYMVHRIVLRIPVFGKLVRAIQVAFFTRILSILLSSGVQIVQAIAVTAQSASNLVFQKELHEVAERVERGEAITDELEKKPEFFPRITTGMIKIGDRTGKLAESLMNAAEFSEKEVDESTKALATLIEPLTLLLVGGLVGFIALSIITPIYEITNGVSK